MAGIFVVGRVRSLRQAWHAVVFALLACLTPTVAFAQFSIARVSSPVFYRDANMPALTALYAGYAITNTSGVPIADVWAGIGNFTGGVITKAAHEDGVVHLGPMSAGQTKMAYFYLNSSGTTAAAQNHTVSLYLAKPPDTAVASANFSITAVNTAIEAQANKVTTIVTGPTPPVLGGVVTMTVTGETGTIGSGNMLLFSPAGYPDWDASAFELYQMTLTLSGSPNAGVVTDSLVHFVSSSSATNYQIVYLFRAANVTSAPTSVSPVGYISSGAQTKHTTTNNYGNFPPVQQPANFITLNKSASPSRMAPGDTVLYTVDLVNSASLALDLDDITDLLPSGASYVTGSSSYQGSAITDPAISGLSLMWNRVFTVPANATAHLTYRVLSPITPGVHGNSVWAHAGAIQVDHTLITSDNSPAIALIGVGDAEVSVAKFATPSPAVRGQQLTYRIVATNNGPNASGGTTVVDTLPAGLGFVSASTTAGTVSQSGGVITAVLGSQASGAHDTVTVVVTVNTSSTLQNRAHADGMLRDLTPSNNVTTLSTPVLAPDVSLDKRHTLGFHDGLSAEYLFVVHNLGTYAAGELTVRDTLPMGLAFVSGSGTGWSFANSGNILTATHPGPLPVGDSLSFGLQVSVGPAAVPSVTNSAVVSTVGDSDAANDRDSDFTAVTGTANLVLDKRHLSDFVEGTNGDYAFVVRNIGTGATLGEIAVVDTLPVGLGFVAGSGTGWTFAESSGVVSATHAGPLAAGDSLTFALTVSVADAAVPAVTNHAFVSGGGDLSPNDNGDSDAATVLGAPDLSLDKIHTGVFRDGSNGSYDLILWNIGNGPTTGTLTVVDTLPAGLTFVSGAGSGWTVSEVDGIVTATHTSSLVAGDSTSFTLTVGIGAAALPMVSNSARVLATNDSDPANDRDTDVAVVDGLPDVELLKSHTGDFHENLTGVYTLLVRNLGDGPTIGEIAVVDSLPDGMSFVAGEGASWAFVDNGGIVTATHPGPLGAGDSLTFTLTVNVGSQAVPQVTNAAVVHTSGDPNPDNDRDADLTSVHAMRDLALDKRHSGPFTDGYEGTYTFVVHNLGHSATVGTITVRDTLPAGLGFVRGEGADWTFDASGDVVTATTERELAAGDSMSFDLAVTIAAAAVPGVLNSAVVSMLGDGNPANDRDSDETAVVGTPDLALTKTHTGHFVMGSDADYRLVVRNVGTASTVGYISVTDTLAVGLTYVSGSGAGWSFHNSGRVVTAFHPGPIAVDDSLVFMIRVNVGSMTTPIIISSAEVSGGGDVRPGNNRDNDPAAVDGVPDLMLDKHHLAGLITGVDAQYAFVVSNVGTSASSGMITVVDTLPAGLGFVSAAGANWTIQNVGQVVTATTPEAIAMGDSLGFTLTVSVGPAALPSVVNAAVVSGGGDNNTANDRDEDFASVNGSIDLAVELSHAAMFEAGQPASWHYVVRNLGTIATPNGFVVRDTLPLGVTYTATTGEGSDFFAQGVHVSWVAPVLSVTQQPGLAPGDSATFDVHVLVDRAAPAWMLNRAVVSTPGDENPANDLAVDPTTVHHTLAASLRLEKRANRDRVELGDAVDYEIVLANDGDGAATATTILDHMPLGFQYQSGTARLDGVPMSDPAGSPGPELSFPLGTVVAGGSHRLSYRALVGVGAPLGTGINSAHAVATGPNDEAIASPVANARVTISGGAFSDLGVIAGKVFADRDCSPDGRQDAEDIGIPGVRVTLETGESAVTDIEGKYSFNHVRPRLHVVRVDESTLPAGAVLAARGTRHSGVGRSQFVDLKAGEYHRADFLEVSRSESVLAEIRERRSRGEVTQAAASVPPSQPSLQVSGIVEARKEFRSLANTALEGGSRDAFEDRLMDARVEDGRGHGCSAGRGAVLVTGDVGNGMRLTGRFDSENDRERLMFRDLRPFDGYDLMGDASIHEANAMSDSRLFVRLEKQGSFAQYGDFQTPNRENQLLGAMQRSATGALTRFVGPSAQFSGFATEGTSHQVVDELPGMGISGPYALSRNDGTMGSERVEVVIRDRNQPTRILSRQGMTRFTDYTIEPFTGRLLFRRPVPSVDPDLNPVSVRVTYEAEGAGEAFWTYGGNASVKADSVITLGIAASRDEDPSRPTSVASLDAQFALPRGMRLAAELAHSDSGATLFDGVRQGEAWRAEFTVQQERVNARVHASCVEPSFDNPSAGVIPGREEMGASLTMTLDSLTQGFLVGLRSESLLNHGRRDGLAFGVSRRLSARWSGDVSYRWAKESAAPASEATIGATPNQTGSLDARLSSQLPGQRPGRVFGEFEQDLSQTAQQRWALGGEVDLNAHTHLYARHENIASFAGPFALNDQQQQARTVVGLSSDAGRDAHTFTEYRARDAFAGRETEAAFGLRNRWQVREGTWLDGSIERVEPLSGPDSTRRQGEATSVTGAVEWTGHPLWKATGRLEFRDAASRDQWLGTLGASRKLNRDWSALGHAAWLLVPVENRVDRRTQLGIAYRQTDGNTVNLLARWENRLERSHPVGQSVDDRGANLITALVNVKPASRWTLTGRVATRWMTDIHDDHESHTTTHLFYSRVLVDLNDLYDLGLTGRVMTSADLSQRRTGMGGEIGVMAVKGLRLAGGYNVFGFKDELGTDRSDHGPYLSLGVKFDEADLGLGQKQGGR